MRCPMTSHVIATARAEADTEHMDDNGGGAMEKVAEVRGVLRANAAVTGACGALVLATGGPLADVLDVGRPVVWAVGVFFVVLAIEVGVLAGRSPAVAVGTARLLAVADAAWAAGTVAVVAAGLLPFPGALLPLAVAVVTAGFAVAEHRAAAGVRPGLTARATATA